MRVDLSGKYETLLVNPLCPLSEPVESLVGPSPERAVVVIPEATICVIRVKASLLSVEDLPIFPRYLFHSISFLLFSLRSSASSHASIEHTPMFVEWHFPQ